MINPICLILAKIPKFDPKLHPKNVSQSYFGKNMN